MTYDFDTPHDRTGTDCLKFDRPEQRHRSADLLSLWVADMDFPTAPGIVRAIERRACHGIFGYTEPGPQYFAALSAWHHQRYDWPIPEEHVVVTPGVVYTLATAVRAYTQPGDAVLIQQPVYYPFEGVVRANERTLAVAPLSFDGLRYSFDIDEFERIAVQTCAKLFLLCNPHNPVGRAWTADELKQLGDVCARNDIIVVSDEIHMDFARPGHAHVPFATISEHLQQRSIVCTSASKTFNLAGLQVANTVIPNEQLRQAFREAVNSSGYSQANTLGLVATQAAYELGGPWLADLKEYLEGNWACLADVLQTRIPQLKLICAESTYLAWIDCRALGLNAAQLERFIEDEAGLWLDCGHIFGAGGEGFIRINIATQRAYLQQALDQLAAAVERLDA